METDGVPPHKSEPESDDAVMELDANPGGHHR